jgi:hypothetical protein
VAIYVIDLFRELRVLTYCGARPAWASGTVRWFTARVRHARYQSRNDVSRGTNVLVATAQTAGIALFTLVICSIVILKITIIRLDDARGFGDASRRFSLWPSAPWQ